MFAYPKGCPESRWLKRPLLVPFILAYCSLSLSTAIAGYQHLLLLCKNYQNPTVEKTGLQLNSYAIHTNKKIRINKLKLHGRDKRLYSIFTVISF